jgi:pilus assembly protein CpaE
MPVVAVLGAKGGVGTSLVATNLALALQRLGRSLLVDLDLRSPSTDLLLDVVPEHSWADLVPVADQLTERQVEVASVDHPTGLTLLAAPALGRGGDLRGIARLVGALAAQFAWIVLDTPSVPWRLMSRTLRITDVPVVVLTPDPLALRGARRLCDFLAGEHQLKAGVVVNQLSQYHPADPDAIARSLGCLQLCALPRESETIGEQVNFGQPVIISSKGPYATQIGHLAERLLSGLHAAVVGRASASNPIHRDANDR